MPKWSHFTFLFPLPQFPKSPGCVFAETWQVTCLWRGVGD